MQILILISILLIALIYLHIAGSRLIFQPDIKIAKILSIIALVMVSASMYISPLFVLMAGTIVRNNRRVAASGTGAVVFGLLFGIVTWVVVIVAYWKFFAGCRKVAFFKKVDLADPLLREKVRLILLDVVKQKCLTQEYNMFIDVNHEDILVETIRSECKNLMLPGYLLSEERMEYLKELADKLKD